MPLVFRLWAYISGKTLVPMLKLCIMCILEVSVCAVHCAVIYNKLFIHCAKLGRSALNLVAIHKVILFKKSAMYIQCILL